MALTKPVIADSISNHVGITKKKSLEVVEILLEIMKKTFESSEDVLISGFGKFCVKDKRERKGRNPATGEDMMLRPGGLTFRCSGQLRDQINGNSAEKRKILTR